MYVCIYVCMYIYMLIYTYILYILIHGVCETLQTSRYIYIIR